MAKKEEKALTRAQWHQQAKYEVQAVFADVQADAQIALDKNKKQVLVLRAKLKKQKAQEKDLNKKIKDIEKKRESSKSVTLRDRLKATKLKLSGLQKDQKKNEKTIATLTQSILWLKASKAQFKAGERTWLAFNKAQFALPLEQKDQPKATKEQAKTMKKKSSAVVKKKPSAVAKKKAPAKNKKKPAAKTAAPAAAVSSLPTLAVGDKAPLWSAAAHDPQRDLLESFQGKKVILYFYPKDNTPGCTKQAIALTEAQQDWVDANTVVIGVSRDSMASHQKFTDQHALNFSLIADVDEAICQSYGVIKDKNSYGKMVKGVERSTFLIDETGRIEKIWRKVKVDKHIDDLRNAVCEKAPA